MCSPYCSRMGAQKCPDAKQSSTAWIAMLFWLDTGIHQTVLVLTLDERSQSPICIKIDRGTRERAGRAAHSIMRQERGTGDWEKRKREKGKGKGSPFTVQYCTV